MKKITPEIYRAITVSLTTVLSWVFLSPSLTKWYLANFDITFMGMLGVFILILFQFFICLYFWSLCENVFDDSDEKDAE